MTTTTTTRPRNTTNWVAKRRWSAFTATAGVTLLGVIILTAFLMPLGYMVLTSFKDVQQIIDPNAPFLPSRPVNFTYQGEEFPIMQVPVDGVTHEWALVEKGREASKFIDPQNPDAGLIDWTGRWRTLTPVYRVEPFTGNFKAADDAVNVFRAMRNSFVIAALGTIGTVLASTAVAYGFARFNVPGKNAMFLILIGTIILPSQVTLIPTYVFFRSIGWGGTWWPLIVPHFFSNAYNVFLLRQYFLSIPKELDEAAWIDGASPFRTLVSVIIPQSWPALTAVAIFHFFFAWNDFFGPLVYLAGKEELYPIAVAMTQFNNAFGTQPGMLMAATLMTISVPVVIFFLAQRQFMQGIVMTGVEK